MGFKQGLRASASSNLGEQGPVSRSLLRKSVYRQNTITDTIAHMGPDELAVRGSCGRPCDGPSGPEARDEE